MTHRKKRKEDWYMSGGDCETVLFVDATPESVVKKRVETVVKRNGMKVKVVERAGTTMKQMLQKSDPFPLTGCGRRMCVMCENEMGVDCRTRGCVYEIECKEEGCGKKYVGMTGRSVYERMKEHINGMVNGREDDDSVSNPLLRHKVLCHGEENVDVNVRIVDRRFERPSRRIKERQGE